MKGAEFICHLFAKKIVPSSLLWEIMVILYFNENEPMTVLELKRELDPARDQGITKGAINSELYGKRGIAFQKCGNSPGSLKPLWNLTSGAHDFMEGFHQENSAIKLELADTTGLFCMTCGDLKVTSYCENPNCKENPVPIGATAVPGEITGGEGKSILKLFGYYAGKSSSKEGREFAIQEAIETIFWIPSGAKNEDYVKSFGEPKSKARCHRLIELLQGFNIPNYLNSREEDIEYIMRICSTYEDYAND